MICGDNQNIFGTIFCPNFALNFSLFENNDVSSNFITYISHVMQFIEHNTYLLQIPEA